MRPFAHEMTHWTRHASRLDRDLGRKRFADAGYEMEELVAEIGAAFLCADLGITPETRNDLAAYIGRSTYSTLSRCLRLTPSGRWTTYWQRRISATYRTVFTRRSTRIPSRIFGGGSIPIKHP
jgi:Zincin-like metallopeptidase